MQHFQVAVIGSGIVGLCAALGSARLDLTTALIAPAKAEPDGKTSALLGESVTILKTLDVWDEAEKVAFPLKTMRIIDGTKRLVRAPQTDFIASEIGQVEFGFNIENKLLGKILATKCDQHSNLTNFKLALENINVCADEPAMLTMGDGSTVSADFIIAADGRNSEVRRALSIGERNWEYPQLALVGNFTHTLPNNDTSTEFHTETGPFTLVPLGKNRSSMVCVVDEKGARDLLSLSKPELNLELEHKMRSILGKISIEADLKSFPLSGMVAKSFSNGPVMLAGEAAHAFPPIGAQGLNLGLRDIKAALELLSTNHAHTPASVGEKYAQMRRADILSRTASVDMLNRSLLSDFLPMQAGRSFGLYALGQVGPLRRLMMREGMAPGSSSKNTNSNSLKNPIERISEMLRGSSRD